MSSQYTIMSVGGSLIIPKTGFNVPFLKKFRQLLLSQIAEGEKYIIVIGGGATARSYQDAAKSVTKLSNDDLDWIGIYSTVYNAQFVRMLFQDVAYKEVITNPRKKIKTNKPLIIAAGEKPGSSTDYRAVLLAKTYGAASLINVSNIEYVYTKDPAIYPDAEKIERIGWKAFREHIAGDEWIAGKNVPFDPVASKEAERSHIQVKIVHGHQIAEVKKAMKGKPFKGTIIE